VADENEFEQTRFDGDFVPIYIPGDQLIPVSDLRTGLRVRFYPAKLIGRSPTTFERFLGALSTESLVRLEEKSTTETTSDIYLLNLSRFRSDSTTIAGTTLISQDLHVYESDPSFSLRLRYNQRQGLLRLLGSGERTYSRERSIRLKAQLMKEIGNQTDYTNKIDRLDATVASPRQRNLVSDELRSEFSYRPYPEWEAAFGVALSEVTNQLTLGRAVADINEQFVRLTYALLSLGQVTGELRREEVSVSAAQVTGDVDLPYEFTGGRLVGKTYLWRAALDYRITQYLQLTMNYDGRAEGNRSVVHNAKAEVRAFF
jgi:hypothetical protein